MFRIDYLKLTNHPQLGNIELNLSEESEYKKGKDTAPYTSVIIGPNGTGKSFILRTVAEIFRQFKEYSVTDKKEFNLPYDFHIQYKYYDSIYEIHVESKNKKGSRKDYRFFKNRPNNIEIKKDGVTNFDVLHQELEYPSRLLVNSIMNNDRFVFKKDDQEGFYQYLGSRATSSTSSTKSLLKRTVNHLFNSVIQDDKFIEHLGDLLNFLEFKKELKVIYSTRINKLFFTQNLSEADFIQYYEEWWDKDFEYTTRDKDNPSWSVPYYNNNIKENSKLRKELIDFLNKIPSDQARFLDRPRTSSKSIVVDLFMSNTSHEELRLLEHLERLDILTLDGIKLEKNKQELNFEDISSGEYHLLISLIGIFSNIKEDSLVLIDEPEISLHPNWQMRYVTFLKRVFSKYSSCHFILTTHSHFLVSDLKDKTSHLIAIKRFGKELTSFEVEQDTFGWSAEQVLLDVFEVNTSRNYVVAERLGLLLDFISKESSTEADIRNRYFELKLDEIQNLPTEDPLKSVLETIRKEYVQ